MKKEAGDIGGSLAGPSLSCLFCALICLGAYVKIPLAFSPVPLALQNFFVFLAAMLLGPSWTGLALVLYLALGAFGLPVFAGGRGGLAYFMGPTAGYLLGYLPGALLSAFLCRIRPGRTLGNILALLAGWIIQYTCGLVWLKYKLSLGWLDSLAKGLLPFLIGDALKIAAILPIARVLAPRLNEALNPRRD